MIYFNQKQPTPVTLSNNKRFPHLASRTDYMVSLSKYKSHFNIGKSCILPSFFFFVEKFSADDSELLQQQIQSNDTTFPSSGPIERWVSSNEMDGEEKVRKRFIYRYS